MGVDVVHRCSKCGGIITPANKVCKYCGQPVDPAIFHNIDDVNYYKTNPVKVEQTLSRIEQKPKLLSAETGRSLLRLQVRLKTKLKDKETWVKAGNVLGVAAILMIIFTLFIWPFVIRTIVSPTSENEGSKEAEQLSESGGAKESIISPESKNLQKTENLQASGESKEAEAGQEPQEPDAPQSQQEIDEIEMFSESEKEETLTLFCGLKVSASEFLYPHSSSSYFTQKDLDSMEAEDNEGRKWKSQMAINEIFARYGYIFTGTSASAQSTREKFEGKSWYLEASRSCPSSNQDVLLYQYFNEYERKNVEMVNEWQDEHGLWD